MAVVKNLMIRVGADLSAMKRAFSGANRDLNRFKNQTDRTVNSVEKSFQRLNGRGLSSLTQGLQSLGKSSPALGGMGVHLGTAASTALLLSSRLGTVGVVVTGVATALGGLVAVTGAASQEAVRYEANLNRLSLALGMGTKDYLAWSKTQAKSLGLSKQAAADMGATQGMILSSFIPDKKELADKTKDMVRTISVVASNSGRSMEDVAERIRSGMLGNTEAIEDLGIFVNVSMIESTEAFRKFAGDKSWGELDFKQQQLIRQQAIVEQAMKRYGNELANNTSSSQQKVIAGLQDIKLNLSQSFKPIWDAVLPALAALVDGLATVTENVARFIHFIARKPYEPLAKNATQATEANDGLATSYGDIGDAAKSASKELAGFDEINLLGGSDSGGGSGSGGGTFPKSNIPTIPMPELPKEPIEHPGIVFKPPTPPDMGMGAVATATLATNANLQAQLQASNALMWQGLQAQTTTSSQGISTTWGMMLQKLQGNLNQTKPAIDTQWNGLKSNVNSLSPVVNTTKTTFNNALTDMAVHTNNKAGSMIGQFNQIVAAHQAMQAQLAAFDVPTATPAPKPAPIPLPKPQPLPIALPSLSSVGKMATDAAKLATDPSTYKKIGTLLNKEAEKPQNKAGLAITGALLPISKATQAVKPVITNAINSAKKLMDNLPFGVPAFPKFAQGGIVDANNPMLAMVGDNKTQKEAIAPVDDLMSMISTAVLTALQGTQNRSGDIVLNIDGVSFARVTNAYNAKETTRIGANMIRVT